MTLKISLFSRITSDPAGSWT